MKKYILLLLLFTTGVINAKVHYGIESDSYEDGARIIISLRFPMYTNFTSGAACKINYTNVDGFFSYNLFIHMNEGNITIPQGAKLLLKLNNGEVITIATFKEFYSQLHDYYYDTDAIYEISYSDLLKISENSVVKVRIETATGFIDRDIKGNMISLGVKNTLPFIIRAAQEEPEEKDIYSNF